MNSKPPTKNVSNTATRTFLIDVEMCEQGELWQAIVPGLEEQGLAAIGATQVIALSHLQDAARIVLDHLIESGVQLPNSVRPTDSPTIAVSI